MALAPKRTLVIGGGLAAVLLMYGMGAGNRDGLTEPAANATQCRITITGDGLRIREAPSTDARIVGRFDRGSETNADKLVQNGFRKIGENRWVSTEFAHPLPGRDCG